MTGSPFFPDASLADGITDWAEGEIVIPSSEALSGRLRLAPYQREILAAFAAQDVRQVTLMAASQTGKTLTLMTMLGYAMTHDPRQMLMASPRLEDTKKFVRTKFTPLHAASDALRRVTRREKGQRYGGWSFSRIEFAGGALTFANAGSPASLRSTTAGYVFADEVDAYPMGSADAENPLDQIRQRSVTFRNRAKMVVASTPIHEDLSIIWREYEDGSRGTWQMPCVDCGAFQQLNETNIVDGVEDAVACVHCSARIDEAARQAMIPEGKWVHADADSPNRSYHLGQLASPFVPIDKTLAERRRGAIWFSHAILAKPYQGGASSRLDPEQADRLWVDRPPLGFQTDSISVGVDVQSDRLEATFVEWDEARPYVVDHRVVAYAKDSREDMLRAFETLGDIFEAVKGKSTPILVLVDSGYLTPIVHDAVRRLRRRRALGGRLYAAKGYASRVRGSFGMELIAESKVRTHDYPAYTTAPDEGKSLAYLMANDDPPLIAVNRAVGQEWMRQFRSERLVESVNAAGVTVKRWVKRRARNEALDCFVLALCAHRILESERMTSKLRNVR